MVEIHETQGFGTVERTLTTEWIQDWLGMDENSAVNAARFAKVHTRTARIYTYIIMDMYVYTYI